MRIRNGDIFPVFEGLASLAKEKFPISFAFRIKRAMAVVEAQAKMYNESRTELVEQYAKRDEDGEKVTKDGGATVEVEPEFNVELAELNDILGDEIDGISTKELIKVCEKNKINIQAQTLFGINSILIDDLGEDDGKEGQNGDED